MTTQAVRALVLSLALLAVAGVCRQAAADDTAWRVSGKLLGKLDKDDNKVKKSEDVSGIACTVPTGFPRACLVIDDELQSAQSVTLNDGEIVAGDPVALIDDAFKGKPLEFDGEGIAYAGGFFYVIGSHGHPRDKKMELDPVKDADKIDASIAANSRVVRIAVDPATGKPVAGQERRHSRLLAQLVAADPTLRSFHRKRLEKKSNGVTIEGIAIQNDRLYAGFRGPSVDRNKAAILSASLGAFFDGAAPDARLHLLRLGKGRGIRDLAAFRDGLLILAGPSAEENGRYSVYWWDGLGKRAQRLKHLRKYETKKGEQLKPEAVLALDRGAKGLRVLLLFDGAEEGGPRTVLVKSPR